MSTNPASSLSPSPSEDGHHRSLFAESDADDPPPVDVNSHLPPSSVRDRLAFWKQTETKGSRNPSCVTSPTHSSHPALPPRLDTVAPPLLLSASKSVKDTFLIRLQLAQSQREEEEQRHRSAAKQSELLDTRHAKHRAQESLQLKITVDSAVAHSPSVSPRPAPSPPPRPTSPLIRPASPASFELDSPSFTVSPLMAPALPPRPPPALLGLNAAPTSSSNPPPASPSPPPVPSPTPATSSLSVASPSVSLPPLPMPANSPPSASTPSISPPPLPLSSSATVTLPPPYPDSRHRAVSSPALSTRTTSDSSASPTSSPSPSSPFPGHSPSASVSSAPIFPVGVDDPPHRALIVSEIISSEASYVASLGTLIKEYLTPMREGAVVSASDLGSIFGGVELLHNFHLVFLDDLRREVGGVAGVVLRLCAFLKMYTAYLQNYTQALTAIDAQRKNKGFQALVSDARRRCGLDLMSYLIMPVQRVPRYELLLRELMRYTPETHSERPTLQAALQKVQAIAQHINASARHAQEMSKLIEIQNSISGEFGTLLLPHRRLIKEGSVMKMKGEGGVLGGGGGGRRLIVFNDILIWTSEAGRFRGHARLEGMAVEGWEDKKGRVGFVLRAEGDERGREEQQQRIFVCATQAECDQWVAAIGDVCQQERRRSGTLKAVMDGKGRKGDRLGGGTMRTMRGTGRETHNKLMESLKELKAKGDGSSRVKAAGEEEEKEAAEEEVDVSRVRRRGSFNSVSMSVSPYAAAHDDE